MDKERKIQIDNIANAIYNDIGLKSFPYDINLAISNLGGRFYYTKNYLDAGIFNRGKYFEFVIESISEYYSFRQKAQFIGILFLKLKYLTENQLDTLESFYWKDIKSYDLEDCIYFSNCFMLPKDEFMKCCNENFDHKTRTYSVSSIAKHFNVSNSLAIERGTNLKMFERD